MEWRDALLASDVATLRTDQSGRRAVLVERRHRTTRETAVALLEVAAATPVAAGEPEGRQVWAGEVQG